MTLNTSADIIGPPVGRTSRPAHPRVGALPSPPANADRRGHDWTGRLCGFRQVSSCWRDGGINPDHFAPCSWHAVTVGGTCLMLASLLGAPSFWYIPCVCALIPLGFVWWFSRPSLAASLSVGPLVAAACLIRFLSDMRLTISLACLIAAVTFVLVALRNSRGWKLPLFISLAYLVLAFCADRMFTNKVTLKTFQMGIALDGNAPWGAVGSEWQDWTPPLVLYRRVGTSYCYTAFKSKEFKELRDHLAQRSVDTSIR